MILAEKRFLPSSVSPLRRGRSPKYPPTGATVLEDGVCATLEKRGANIPRKPGPMKHGTTHIAFIADPDGYKIELIDLDTRG